MLTTATAFVIAAAVLGTQATAEPPHLATQTAKADPSKLPADDHLRERVLCVEQAQGQTVVVRVHPSIRTRWRLLDQVVSYELGISADYEPQLDERQRKRFRIQPLENASPTNLVLETSVTMTYLLVPVARPEQAVGLVIVQRKDPITGELQPPAQCDANDSEPDPHQRLLGGKLIEKEVLPGITSYFRSDTHELRLQTSPRSVGEPGMWFSFVITNTGDRAFPPTGLAMSDGHSNTDYLLAWQLEDGTRDLPELLAPGETLRGALLARNAAQLRKGFELHLLGTPGVVAAAFGWETEPEPEPVNKGRLSLQLQAIGGAISLKSTVDSNQSDFTSLTGLGGRAIYGFASNLSFEGTLSGLSSGNAQFNDSSTTEVTTARLLLGGILRFGESYVPYVRAGFGAQISSYSSMSVAGDTNSDLRSGLLAYGGLGIDAWLGQNFVIGISGAFMGSADSTSFEGGLHLGYAWKP